MSIINCWPCLKCVHSLSFRSAVSVFSISTNCALTWASTSDTSSLCVSGVGRTSIWNSILMNTWRHTQVRCSYTCIALRNPSYSQSKRSAGSFRRETIYLWDLWEELHESSQYEAAPAYAHRREALPLWSMRPAVPLLQHAKSPPREVFPGQEPSPAGLLCYNQSNTRTAGQDGNTEGY